MLSLCSLLALLSAVTHAAPTVHQPYLGQKQSPLPCNDLAKEQAVYLAGNPALPFPTAIVPASLLYDCLVSVPVQKGFSIRLVKNVRAWFELHSDIDYIASPPSGSVWRPLHLLAFLDDITEDLYIDKYKCQYDFEVDLYTWTLHSHDGHTRLFPGLFRTGKWYRRLTIVSYSTNGLEIPKVYLTKDALTETDFGLFKLRTKNADLSPVATINNIPVQEYLQTQALEVVSHDPDAMYNQLLTSIPLTFNPSGRGTDSFWNPSFYPGSETSIEREDGTMVSIPVLSVINCDLSRITTGDEFWQKCVFERDQQFASTSVSASATEETTTSTATAMDRQLERTQPTTKMGAGFQLRGHPRLERVDIDNLLSGYFPEGFEDVAVLVIRSFLGGSSGYLESFQDTLQSSLEHAKDQGKTKLIVDLSGNGGGYVDAGTELLARLFPNAPLDQKHNMRASLGLKGTLDSWGDSMDTKTQNATSEKILLLGFENPDAWQSMTTPDGAKFASFKDFYGPNEFGGRGNYTHFFQGNYTNTDPSELDQEGIQITGHGNRSRALGTQPPFNASNMVVLTDGACASACPMVVEMLLNTHRAPSIVVGGRPSTGPMQMSGSAKGSALCYDPVLNLFLKLWEHSRQDPDLSAQIASTPFAHLDAFGLTHGHMSLNGKNNYRMGDDTETPLQMVYSAADCRIWPTLEMLTNQSHV